MLLSNYNVNQQLKHFFNAYLAQTPLPFATLKALIIDKKPIDEISGQINGELNAIKTAEQEQSKTSLGQSAYQKQVREDEDEKSQDLQSERSDQSRLLDLGSELQRTKMLRDQSERELLLIDMIGLASSASHPVVHHHHRSRRPHNPNVHGHPSVHSCPADAHPYDATGGTVHTHPSTGSVHTHTHIDINPNVFRANALRQSIYSLNQRILDINTEINSIDSKRLTRQQRRDMRDARIQARLDLAHNKLGITLIDTLSPINKSSLFYKIQTEHACIDDRCSSLIKEAGRANYSVFIQQLEFNLSKGILTVPEDEALRTVIKLMKQHQEQEKRVANIEAQLNATIKTIRDDQFKRQQLAARLESLKGANPNLTRANEQLVLENRTLDSTRGQNNQSRDRLITPSLILAGSSLITSIPLILTLSGVIPVVLVPALFFSLLAFPPALLIIATLTVGIVALVYAIKSAINSSNIQKNEATIAQNTQQMQQNLREITELQTTTIPGLDVTIRTNQHAQTKLDESLQQATALSAQTLQQAKNTEPLGYAKAPFLLFANNLYPQLPTAPQYSPVKASAPPMDFDAEGSTPPAYSEEEASAPPAYSDLEPSAPPMEEVFGRKLA